jgi:hypothetical protein
MQSGSDCDFHLASLRSIFYSSNNKEKKKLRLRTSESGWSNNRYSIRTKKRRKISLPCFISSISPSNNKERRDNSEFWDFKKLMIKTHVCCSISFS